MKKIFILTGEPSGDKLASEVVKKIINFDKDINFLGVCGKHLKALGINSIFDQNEIKITNTKHVKHVKNYDESIKGARRNSEQEPSSPDLLGTFI